VRKEVIHREGRVEEEKVDVDSTRVSIGGDNREGEGGRDGDRVMGEEEGGTGRRGVTPTKSVWDDDGEAKKLSEVASLSASSNGMTTVVVVGSASTPSISTAVDSAASVDCGGEGCCGGWGVTAPEGMVDERGVD
jgi:hypothetical protein